MAVDSYIIQFSTEKGVKMAKKRKDAVERLLMKRRTIGIGDSFDRESIADVTRRMLQLESESNERMTLLINSNGGKMYTALELCDLMTHLFTAPVRGITVGQCYSAATLILLHCTERLSMPNTLFLIHSGSFNDISFSADKATEQNAQDLLKESKFVADMLTKLYMKRLGKDKKFVESLISRGDQRFNETMSAEEALEVGLVERIITEKLDIFSTSET